MARRACHEGGRRLQVGVEGGKRWWRGLRDAGVGTRAGVGCPVRVPGGWAAVAGGAEGGKRWWHRSCMQQGRRAVVFRTYRQHALQLTHAQWPAPHPAASALPCLLLQVSGWAGAKTLHAAEHGGSAVAYTGMMDCFAKTVREEGMSALFKVGGRLLWEGGWGGDTLVGWGGGGLLVGRLPQCSPAAAAPVMS